MDSTYTESSWFMTNFGCVERGLDNKWSWLYQKAEMRKTEYKFNMLDETWKAIILTYAAP